MYMRPAGCKQSDTELCGTCQALEYVNKQGGLPVAARYLARAVALPPSNTSWYMGLSNGAAGLCKPPASHPDITSSTWHDRGNVSQLKPDSVKAAVRRAVHADSRSLPFTAALRACRRPASDRGEQPKGGGGGGGDLHGGPGGHGAGHQGAPQA